MKKPILSLLIAVGLIGSASASVIFQDNFNGYTINTNDWTENLYGNSSIAQSNGTITLNSAPSDPYNYNRAVLTTVQGFNQPIAISGTFSLQGTSAYFLIATRSSGLADINYNAPYGLEVQVLDTNPWWYLRSAQILNNSPSGDTQIAAIQGISFNPQATNSYQFIDYGDSVSFYLNGNLLINTPVDPSFSEGNQVSLSDSGAGETSVLGPVSITAVPEPSTYALFGLGAIGILMVLRRKKTV
jgi:PEP-CTERM motif